MKAVKPVKSFVISQEVKLAAFENFKTYIIKTLDKRIADNKAVIAATVKKVAESEYIASEMMRIFEWGTCASETQETLFLQSLQRDIDEHGIRISLQHHINDLTSIARFANGSSTNHFSNASEHSKREVCWRLIEQFKGWLQSYDKYRAECEVL